MVVTAFSSLDQVMLDDPVVVNDWHVVARSTDVKPGAVVGVRLLGRAIALWRNGDQLLAWADQCPHRGAQLSLGQVKGGALVCPYHAWEFNAAGRCTKIPAHPDLAIPQRAQITAYRVEERYSMIWVCLGEPQKDIPPFPEWDDERFGSFLCGPYEVDASGPRLIENFLDVGHLPFVHDGTLGKPDCPTIPPYQATFDGEGVIAKHVTCYLPDDRGFGGTMAAYTYCVFRPLTTYLISENLDPCFSVVLWVTPLDVYHSLMWFYVAYDRDTPVAPATLAEWQDKIVRQDIPIVASQQPKLLPLDARAELHVASAVGDRLPQVVGAVGHDVWCDEFIQSEVICMIRPLRNPLGKAWRAIALALSTAFLVVACASTETPQDTATTTTPEEGAQTLHIAAMLSNGPDHAWDATFLESYKNVQQAAPHGVEIADIVHTDGVWGEQAEAVMREYAETGKYDIIWANSSYADQVEKLMGEYPDILWVYVGSGNRSLGGNAYWLYKRIHEPAYLMGMIAGKMTENNIVGAVGTYAFDDVNDHINAFFDGAKASNPDVQTKVSFIESWYDPNKAAEAANAQIAAGVDHMYMVAEAFEPCQEKNIACYGIYKDYSYAAPDNILTSALAKWEPEIEWIVDQWWEHKTNGTPYAAPTESKWFSMAEGGSDLAPLSAAVPEETKAEVETSQADILSGALKVELKLEPPTAS